MTLPDNQLITRELSAATVRLCACLDTLRGCSSPNLCTLSPQSITHLLTELRQAGEWIRLAPANRPPELQRELEQYRTLVERLRDLMPHIHATLLAERDRIEQERARIHSAIAWARRSTEIL